MRCCLKGKTTDFKLALSQIKPKTEITYLQLNIYVLCDPTRQTNVKVSLNVMNSCSQIGIFFAEMNG